MSAMSTVTLPKVRLYKNSGEQMTRTDVLVHIIRIDVLVHILRFHKLCGLQQLPYCFLTPNLT